MGTVSFDIDDIEEDAFDFTISGASDDIIQFHGHIRDEQDKYDGGLVLEFKSQSRREGVRIRMDYDGIWRPQIGLLEDDEGYDGLPIPDDWHLEVVSDFNKNKYSAFAHLRIPESFMVSGEINEKFFAIQTDSVPDTKQYWYWNNDQ